MSGKSIPFALSILADVFYEIRHNEKFAAEIANLIESLDEKNIDRVQWGSKFAEKMTNYVVVRALAIELADLIKE